MSLEDYGDMLSDSRFVDAYLHAKRQQVATQQVSILVVKDESGVPQAFGLPCDWDDGVASRVHQNLWSLERIVVDVPSNAGTSLPKVLSRESINNKLSAEFDDAFMEHVMVGVSFDKGVRQSMEDTHVIVPDFLRGKGIGKHHFYAVYDGHAGASAAWLCKEHLHSYIAQNFTKGATLSNAVLEGFHQCDEMMLEKLKEEDSESGSTAIALIVNEKSILAANVGDCRAVLSRAGTAVPLSTDHSSSDLKEQNRIAVLGGFVEFGFLNGYLAVSRALGGFDQRVMQKIPGLSGEPDVKKFYLSEEDEFIIIACDGLWDVFDNQGAVHYTRQILKRTNDVVLASDRLVEEALRRESDDNVTVMIVGFDRWNPISGKRSIITSDSDKAEQWRRKSSPRISSKSRPKMAISGLSSLAEAIDSLKK